MEQVSMADHYALGTSCGTGCVLEDSEGISTNGRFLPGICQVVGNGVGWYPFESHQPGSLIYLAPELFQGGSRGERDCWPCVGYRCYEACQELVGMWGIGWHGDHARAQAPEECRGKLGPRRIEQKDSFSRCEVRLEMCRNGERPLFQFTISQSGFL